MNRRRFIKSLLGGLGGSLLTTTVQPHSTKRILIQESPIAGIQYHRAEAVWPFLRTGETLHLKREPQNRYDRNAISVWFRNEKLGYVPRRENTTLAQMIDHRQQLEGQIIRLAEDNNPWQRIRISVSLIS
ncbi:MAG: HIRAN protein [Gammaproteobacteria bacterium]|nr:HIRAN protein [Gammaproteobacteria bacterium]